MMKTLIIATLMKWEIHARLLLHLTVFCFLFFFINKNHDKKVRTVDSGVVMVDQLLAYQ